MLNLPFMSCPVRYRYNTSFGAEQLTCVDDIGEFPKGTVLASGNSWGNKSTNIDLYASHDKGHSWKFVSKVATGGRPNTTNGADPIWEPFILYVFSEPEDEDNG
jgi:hypothetical protein